MATSPHDDNEPSGAWLLLCFLATMVGAGLLGWLAAWLQVPMG